MLHDVDEAVNKLQLLARELAGVRPHLGPLREPALGPGVDQVRLSLVALSVLEIVVHRARHAGRKDQGTALKLQCLHSGKAGERVRRQFKRWPARSVLVQGRRHLVVDRSVP